MAGSTARFAVFDAHADSLQRQLDLGHDLGRRGPGHLDCVRGREGGLEALVFVCWVDPKHLAAGRGAAFARTEALLGEFHHLVARHPDRVRFAGDGAALATARATNCIAGVPGIEGGHSLEEDLAALEHFFERGVRVLTLVWNNHLSWIRSCQDGAAAGVPEGLGPFGRRVVERMNELGMVVDLSHAGERSFYDALDASSEPVIASHSGCRAVNEHQRNLDDDQLRALAANEGVVGIVFCTPFLSRAAALEEQRLRETPQYRALRGDDDTALFLAQSEFLQEHAAPLSLDAVVAHVEHAVEVAGIDHVGIGSDFDGIQRTPRGLEDASCYPRLAARLLERGFSPADVEKVMAGNMRRVFERVTRPGKPAHGRGLTPLARG